MDHRKLSTDRVTVNSIIQTTPTFDLFPGVLGAVVTKHSWGCDVRIAGDVRPVTWQHMEPTGGTLKFDTDGKPLADLSTPFSHHE